MRVAVTGASGYVGSRLVTAFERAGFDVLRLGRPAFSLEGGVDVRELAGVDVLVHPAWDFAARDREAIERINVEGSKRLFDAAAAAGVRRLIFVSTLSAFPGARSMYGRAKLSVEEHVLALGGVVVRPGLVWSESGGGSLFAALAGLARRVPVLPVFTGESRKLYLAHEDDLAALVVSLARTTDPPAAPVPAAAAEPLSLARILEGFAAAHGRRLRTIYVPWRIPWAGLRALELLGLSPPFRSDSVVSLVSLDQHPFGPDGPPAGFREFSPG